jgi:hypothetical protein
MDVAPTNWFYEDISYVYDKGLMVGIGESSFSPAAPTTCGMLVTIIGRQSGTDMSQYAGACLFACNKPQPSMFRERCRPKTAGKPQDASGPLKKTKVSQ